MAGLGALISSLLNLGANLLPEVKNTFFAPSSSSSAQLPDAHAVEADLKRLMRLLERIEATLHDAEERNIRDKSVQLWLKELRELAHEAEYVLDEYMYEVYRAQVEARNASELNPVKGEPEVSGVYSVQIPEGMVDRIREITSRFEEISKDREALCLREEEAPRRCYNGRQQTPTSHLVVEKSVFGREKEKEQVIDLLFSDDNQGKVLLVLPIMGKGGLGKTTIAQLVYNDERVQDRFDLSGWVCVSEDFNIKKITRDIIECFTKSGCDLKNPSVLLERLAKIIRGKNVFLVLDDVWNEDRGLWELLRTPLMLARTASILVTTRNNSVANIMQTMDPLQLAYLSDDKCWLLFTHYAFQGLCRDKQTCFVEIGKKIVKKCGGLSLAVKSIASLLSHEAELQNWIEIFESDLWELDAGNEILAPLQISYERMPAYLKPCLLLCSMFSKDYWYNLNLMSRLWIAHGYVEPRGRKNIQEVAAEYAKELRERSFFDDFNIRYAWNGMPIITFRLHDMVHGLAWLNSEKTCYSFERGKRPSISKEVRHLYLNNQTREIPKLLTSINIPVLETMVMTCCPGPLGRDKNGINLSGLSKAGHLRSLDIQLLEDDLVLPFSLGNLKHLRSLSIWGTFVGQISPQSIFSCYSLRILVLNLSILHMGLEGIGNLINLESLQLLMASLPDWYTCQLKLPESLGLLRKLRVLEIGGPQLYKLPESTGNLVELHRIVIKARYLRKLPESFCKLTNLKKLILECDDLEELPEEFGNLTSLQCLFLDSSSFMHMPLSCVELNPSCTMKVHHLFTQPDSSHGAVGWLKDFNDLKGVLTINGINRITSIVDALNANINSKHNLETLSLNWDDIYKECSKEYSNDPGGESFSQPQQEVHLEEYSVEKGILRIEIGYSKNYRSLYGQDLQILEIFQPHPNLRHLSIESYGGLVLPRWMGDPLSCASLVELRIRGCCNISSLPLGNVLSLKHLHVTGCGKLLFLKSESLPSQLETLTLGECQSLVEVDLLESLVEVHIFNCIMLKSLWTIDQQMPETASELSEWVVIGSDDCHIKPPKEWKSFPSLEKMTIRWCRNLSIRIDQLLLAKDCEVFIFGCLPELRRLDPNEW